jgi:hypothetical protein
VSDIYQYDISAPKELIAEIASFSKEDHFAATAGFGVVFESPEANATLLRCLPYSRIRIQNHKLY